MQPYIVIVDDMPEIAEIIEQYFQCAGFSNIATFTDPVKALHGIRGGPCPDILITDFDMPRINGVELLDQVKRQCPGVLGIVVTGMAEQTEEIGSTYKIMSKGDRGVFEELVRVAESVCEEMERHEREGLSPAA